MGDKIHEHVFTVYDPFLRAWRCACGHEADVRALVLQELQGEAARFDAQWRYLSPATSFNWNTIEPE